MRVVGVQRERNESSNSQLATRAAAAAPAVAPDVVTHLFRCSLALAGLFSSLALFALLDLLKLLLRFLLVPLTHDVADDCCLNQLELFARVHRIVLVEDLVAERQASDVARRREDLRLPKVMAEDEIRAACLRR